MGQRLLPRAAFHAVDLLSRVIRLPLPPPPSTPLARSNRTALIAGTVGGAITVVCPVPEMTFRRLDSLQVSSGSLITDCSELFVRDAHHSCCLALLHTWRASCWLRTPQCGVHIICTSLTALHPRFRVTCSTSTEASPFLLSSIRQVALVNAVEHVAGLNPRAFRALPWQANCPRPSADHMIDCTFLNE